MQSALTLTCLVFGLLSTSFASPVLTSHAISSSLYDDLVLYTKYSSAVYQWNCPSPLGNTLVRSFSVGDTQGFIARDDDRKEIVVSFRGTSSLGNALTDVNIALVPFTSPGIAKSFNVHSGFLAAYNDVADIVLTTVEAQVAKFPKYSVVVTGHSLGGALAALGAVSVKTALPSAALKLYTFGQPRTGDAQWAAFAESTIGVNNIFRAVHTFGKQFHEMMIYIGLLDVFPTDGVPTMTPRILGYKHHSTEYWQFEDPVLFTSGPTTVKKCAGKEDPSCSDSILSTGINAAHLFYFGQAMALNPSLCV
ncbi:Alpha/beta-hydrolase [Mycena venus]|uniref:Alpha/beta-hydrolase n=1 Tax=Mycena venus TaxID=2733690 RepID=A0A8H6X5X6_9AGAR|nr:Alpha/beta-hydrolase [Mycena venus]